MTLFVDNKMNVIYDFRNDGSSIFKTSGQVICESGGGEEFHIVDSVILSQPDTVWIILDILSDNVIKTSVNLK